MSMNDQQRIEHDLRSIHRWIARLRWFLDARGAPQLTELDGREVEAFPFEWADVVDRIARVGQVAARGSLGPSQLEDLRGITTELVELQPSVKGLRLRYPDLDALVRAAGHPATAQPT